MINERYTLDPESSQIDGSNGLLGADCQRGDTIGGMHKMVLTQEEPDVEYM